MGTDFFDGLVKTFSKTTKELGKTTRELGRSETKSQGKSALLRKSKLISVILFTDDILRVMELIVS